MTCCTPGRTLGECGCGAKSTITPFVESAPLAEPVSFAEPITLDEGLRFAEPKESRFMMSWVYIVISALAAASAVVVPAVTDLVKDNPLVASLVAAVGVILAALAKSPLGTKPEPK